MVVNCEHVWHEISNYLEGEVSPELRAAIEEHVKGCKHCTAVLDGTRNVVRLYGDERLLEVPSGFSRRLQRRLAQETSSSRHWGSWGMWVWALAAAALIVGGLSLGSTAIFRPSDVRSKLAQPGGKIPPELQVIVCDEGRVFHVPGCKYLHKHDDENPKTMTAQEALHEGYTPCVRCLKQYITSRIDCPRPAGNGRFAEQRIAPELQPELWPVGFRDSGV
jgi:hypothetical protein